MNVYAIVEEPNENLIESKELHEKVSYKKRFDILIILIIKVILMEDNLCVYTEELDNGSVTGSQH